MKKIFFISLVLLAFLMQSNLFAQKETYNWYFGNGAGITFNPNGNNPTALTDCPITFSKALGTMSDKDGNLLFYTNGLECRNKYHQRIASGDSLLCFNMGNDAITIVPNPGNPNQYYIFTIDTGIYNGLWYSIIDVSKNDGEVIIRDKIVTGNIVQCTEAIKHGNDHDIWLLTRQYPANIFVAYRISKTKIEDSVVSKLNVQDSLQGRFSLNASLNGRKLVSNDYSQALEAFDFDNQTGKVSNPLFLGITSLRTFTSEISADGTKIYGLCDYMGAHGSAGNQLMQIDLADNAKPKVQIYSDNASSHMNSLQIGPDKKIYIGIGNAIDSLFVINSPDSAGLKCSFQKDAISLSGRKSAYLPDFLYDYKIPIAWGTNACIGDTIFLAADSIPNAIYSWTGPNGFSSNKQNPFIPNAKSNEMGYYTVNITNIVVPVVDSVYIKVYGYPVAAITSTGYLDFCNKDSVILTALPTGAGYSYQWSNGYKLNTMVVKEPGTYWVKVSNENGCTDSASITLVRDSVPGKTTIVLHGGSVLCNGDSLILEATKDCDSLTYFWSTGETTKDIVVSKTGKYSVTVISDKGDTTYATTEIYADTMKVIINSNGKNYICNGDSLVLNGSWTGNLKRLRWSTGDSTPNITIRKSGVYKLIAESVNGCVDIAMINIIDYCPPLIKIVVNGPKTICYGDSTFLKIQTTEKNLTYKWSTGDTTSFITVYSAGIFTVTSTNTTGCSSIDSITISSYPRMNVDIKYDGATEFCLGDSLILTGTPYGSGKICKWSNGQKTSSIVVKSSGVYTYTVTNSNGCTENATVVVKVNAKLKAEIQGKTQICSMETIRLTAMPIGTGYKYLWSTGETNPIIDVTSPGNYWVVVTLNSKCSDSTNILITDSPKPVAGIIPSGATQFCKGDSVILKAKSDSSDYTYKWLTGENTDSITVKSTGNYLVIVTNKAGCSDTASIYVNVIDKPDVKIQLSGSDKICEGDSVQLSATPTGSGFKYLWNTNETTPSIFVSKIGKYIVKVSLNDNCFNSDSVEIIVNPKPIINITGDSVICSGSTDTLSVQNMTSNQNYFQSYLWNTGETTKQISINKVGIYSVTVTDTNGCNGSASFEVKEYQINLTGLKDLDFSTVSIGTQTGASVLLKNESNADVDIKSIHSQNNTQEFKIISNPPIPKTLIPGDTIHIMITFTPSEVKDYLDSIIVETGKPCQNIFIRKIKGNGIGGGKTTIWLPDTLAHVGDVDYCIPFMAKNDDTIKINQALNFTAEIRYDVTALFPDTDFPVVAGERIISLKGSNILLQNKELELDNFCGKIFLPNLDRTLLRITKFEWSNPKIEKTIKDGSLTVNGVCQQTITRIRMFTPLTLEVSPNPANELIITYYNLPKEGLVKLTLVSFLGQEIAVLINEEQKPGEHNCVLIIDNYGLVEGLYFLKLVTSGEAITEKVFIIK